ncbi:unnamed protein product [Rotaria magnacalcarata]|uniref:Uncharacterized protein n=1 Tax=Rotaria magnacalcarata TaxID=392030 RepID=A0A816YJD3_9BILA|nr:unnamed protein product [Rotaria magnacalcarata]CAF1588985.1 unnamed protein product [Rotaria magnacalcarata]CAF2160097.1 unnamed protein product [Rotaria magnacalcarata]CAF3807670.1 unnamed protein product [Rotaria magnacalcarata]CAF4118066.1 unnamed protein product [Rotaria magnacalcarata]
MRTSIKRPSIIIPRPTKASLARQSKIRNSILGASATTNTTNTLKPIQNEDIKSENDLSTIGVLKQQVRRASAITKNVAVFKRRRSVHKLAAIVSGSSLDNSTGDGETLKQVIVASLTENVKKMDLVEQPKTKYSMNSDNKENRASKRPTTLPANLLRKKPIPIPIQLLDKYAAEEITIDIIEQALTSDDLHIDEDDEPIDPTYAMDYVADIMNLLYSLEKRYPIQSTFLTSTSTTTLFPLTTMATMANGSASRPWKLTTKHRTTVVGWIIQLFYARFHLSQDAMHICIGLLDRFLQQCINSTTAGAGFVTQKNLQLIAVASFLIAAKVEETHHPPVDELVYVTDHTYTSDQVKKMEKKILHELRFELNRPTSLQFLRRFSFVSSAGDEQHAIGKFLIDMSLLNVSCIGLAPSLVAASATYIARYILNPNQPLTFDQCWPQELQSRSPYKTYESMSNGVKILAQFIDKCLAGTNSKECEILTKRYEHEQLSQASLFCMQQRTLIHKLATE